MTQHFPLKFTLESGTEVLVNDTGDGRYEFLLDPEGGAPRRFLYSEGLHTKAEWDELLDYEQLEALRKFWLEMEEIK